MRDIQCPLDTKRTQVSSPQWDPMMMSDFTASATSDLVKILHGTQSVSQRTHHHMPLLVDENIHYRLLKLVCGLSYAKVNVPMFLNRTPVLYPYKYCTTLCWRRFYVVFIFLCYGRLFAGKLVPSFPKRMYVERLVVVLVHVAHRWKNSPHQKLRNLRTVPPPNHAADKEPLMQVAGMIDLFYSYVPTVFVIACHVGNCHWGNYANSNMSTVLFSRCLHVYIRLRFGYEHKVEYVCTLMVARLLNHHPWFSHLPGLPSSEEPCEAMRSRVVAKMARYPHMHSLERIHDLFVLVGPPCGRNKDLTYCNIPKGLPWLINDIFRRLCERLHLGMILAVHR